MPQVTFRYRDLKTALRAAREAGISIAGIELRPDGGVVIRAGDPQVAAAEDDDAAIDRMLEERIRNAEV